MSDDFKKKPPFVMLPHEVFDSAAYRSLSPAERAVLAEVIRRYNSRNNGRITLGLREAADACNIDPKTAGKAFRGLLAKGFIETTFVGSYAIKHRASEYRLTWFECDKTGRRATNLFLHWEEDGVFSVPEAA